MRINRNQMYMDIARVVSKRSTCFRLNVGAVLVRDTQIVSIGYNGAPSGVGHCLGNSCTPSPGSPCTRALHAEANAIDKLPQLSAALLNSMILYTTNSPCIPCTDRILDCDMIHTVIFETPYRVTSSLDILIRHGVKVFRHTPSGYLINHETNEIKT